MGETSLLTFKNDTKAICKFIHLHDQPSISYSLRLYYSRYGTSNFKSVSFYLKACEGDELNGRVLTFVLMEEGSSKNVRLE